MRRRFVRPTARTIDTSSIRPTIFNFDTAQSFSDYKQASGNNREAYYGRFPVEELNNMDLQTIEESIWQGDESTVKLAEDYTKHIEDKLTLPPTGGFEVVRSPFGARVNTGEWLIGSPTPCRRKTRRSSDIAPIKIIVGSFVSCGVSADQYTKRSAAIIAFLQIVQRYRPVDLFVSLESDLDGQMIHGLIKLEARPLNLSQVGFMVGHIAFARVWGLAFLASKGVTPTIPAPRRSVPDIRHGLDLTPEDVYIKSAVYGDELIADPDKWIENELKRITDPDIEEKTTTIETTEENTNDYDEIPF